MTTPVRKLRHRIRNYDIGTDLLCDIRYDITTPGTTLQHRVRHYLTGYDITSPGTTLHHLVRHKLTEYDITSPGTTLQLRTRHCITEYDIVQYWTGQNDVTPLLFCLQFPSIAFEPPLLSGLQLFAPMLLFQ